MTRLNAQQAIEGPCKYAGIEVEDNFSNQLLDRLSPEGAEIELTYLQVYLDKIFRTVIASEERAKQSAIGITFTNEVLEKLGDVKDLLGSFLEEQIAELTDPDTALVVLKAFVSTKGTKRQVIEDDVLEYSRTLGKDIKKESLLELILRFISLRILRDKDENGRYELRHDALASKIYEKITLVEKELLEVRQFIENSFDNFQRRKVFLSASDLSYIAPYENKMFLSGLLEQFVLQSKNEIHKIRKRKRNIAIAAVALLFVIFTGFTIWALNERNKAFEKERDANELYIKSRASNYNFISKEVLETDPTKSLRIAEYAYSLDTTNNAIFQNLLSIYYSQAIYKKIFKWDEGYVRSVTFSPDGKTILTGGGSTIFIGPLDNIARLWDLHGNLIQIFKGHENAIVSVCFSPDGKTIITGSIDKTARLWDLEGNILQIFKGHEYTVSSVCFSPDGKTILTGSADKTVRLWDLDGNILQIFKGHGYTVSSVCFSPDGKNIITGSKDATARLWDLHGNLLKIFKGHENWISSVCFSPNGKTVLTGSGDKSARLWNLSGNLLQVFKGHEEEISSVTFSPDGNTILTGSSDNTARLWDLQGNPLQVFRGLKEEINCVTFSPDGKTILAGSLGESILWDLDGGIIRSFGEYENGIKTVNFSPSGTSFITGTSMLVQMGRNKLEYFGYGMCCNTIRLLDMQGNVLQTFIGHENGIFSICFSPDGKTILTGSFDKTARLWDLQGNLLQVFKGHKEGITSVGFSPEGKTILTGSFDKTARLWDLEGNILQIFKGHGYTVSSVCFSPDGKNIITGSEDATARLWDLHGNLLKIFKGHEDWISSVCFSPNGKTVLTGSGDKSARLWNLSGNLLQVFKGHEEGITSVGFSPEGKTILTGSFDKTARLWDLEGNILQIFKGHERTVTSLCFSLDGKSFLTGSADRTVLLWAIKTPYKKFKEKGEYPVLNITDKLKYDIINYKDFQNNNSNELIEGIDFYLNSHRENIDIKNPNISIDIAVKLAYKFVDIYPKQAESYLKILYIYNSYNDTTTIKDMYIKKNEIFRKLMLLPDSEKIVASNWYFEFANNTDNVLAIENFNNAIKLLENSHKSKEIDSLLVLNYNNLALKYILTKNFKEALAFAKKGVSVNNLGEYINTKLTLAYLLNNMFDKFKEIALKHRNNKLEDGRTFKDYILNKLDELEKEGISNPDFAKARALFNKS